MDTPIPKDIPLPLPAPEGLLTFLIVVSLICHLLFVHLTLGTVLLSLFAQVKGLNVPVYDRLAKYMSQTVTTNKSLAVVIGVAPLLVINTLYTSHFYASSILLGVAWMSVIPMVTIAFLLAYCHKYWWDKLHKAKEMHLGLAVGVALLLLSVGMIFMTNVNLMLYPERWHEVKGFFSAMMLPNVLPRYAHFITATLLFSSLYFAWKTSRPGFQDELDLTAERTADIRRFFYGFALGGLMLHAVSGFLVYVTLPSHGVNWTFTLVLFAGALPSLFAAFWLWQDLQGPDAELGRRIPRIAAVLLFTVVFMVSSRHIYRNNALGPSREAIAVKTAAYLEEVKKAREEADLVQQRGEPLERGEMSFKRSCSACHDVVLSSVGPSMVEIRKAYEGRPEAIAAWAKAPGKKDPKLMQMPSFGHLDGKELADIADYILKHQFTGKPLPLLKPSGNGEQVFKVNCSACHHPTLKTVGPPISEIRKDYAGKPDGIVKWTQAPGKKRPEAMQMPAFANIPESDLKAVAEYLLKQP